MNDSKPAAQVAALRRPADGRPSPITTYRLQLNADFTFDDARDTLPYLSRLGATHLYLSPILQATPGSTHGYDVIDHERISDALGGEDGFERLADAAREAGFGLVVDLVPNHMAVPTPAWHNRPLWSVLADGPDSPYASWFDVDWSAGEGAVLMPVLGERIGDALAGDAFSLETMTVAGDDAPQTVLRYYEHAFPVRSGTEHLPMAELLDRQYYRLAWWKVADEELNYRRFFDVGTLAAIRVERDDVFDATHERVVDYVKRGLVDGLRIDHPDGLADPRGYLARLAEQTDGSWVAVEKILAPDETLPDDWASIGTTGYDAMWRVHATFTDPGGAGELGALQHRLTGDPADGLHAMIDHAKREIVSGPLQAEVTRLSTLAAELCHDDIRLRDHSFGALRDCLVELLVAADRYRYYVIPGEPMLPDAARAFEECVERARAHLADDRHATLDVLQRLLQGQEAGSAGRTRETVRGELMVRFQQTCGAVMAKGVEDTTFYRWTQLIGLCEVGGAPERFAISPEELHAWASEVQRYRPYSMTAMSTHDTKRSEDVRMRLGVLSETAAEWNEFVTSLQEATAAFRSPLVDGRIQNFIWQIFAGTWDVDGPPALERLEAYFQKAMREAKYRTGWTAPDLEYETAVLDYVRACYGSPGVIEAFVEWQRQTEAAVRAATLGIKLVQLTLPGVADVYQGTESVAIALVDPDNRRAVPYGELAARLERLDRGATPRTLDDEKLAVTARTLRVRREHADAFVGTRAGYRALPGSSGNAFAFARLLDDEPVALVVATRLAHSLQRYGGWQDHMVVLPDGRWHCHLQGRTVDGGECRLDDLLSDMPVALLTAAAE